MTFQTYLLYKFLSVNNISVDVKEEHVEQQVEGEKSKVRVEVRGPFGFYKVCTVFLYDNVCFFPIGGAVYLLGMWGWR